jgi:cell division protein FtsB
MSELTRRLRPRLGIGPQVVVLALALGLAGAMAVEPTRQLLEQRARISGMQRDLHRLQRSNEQLAERIDRLKDPDYLEQQAREQMGLVRPGETTFVVMPPGKRTRSGRPAPKERPREAPARRGFLERLLRFIGV